jgi:septal ring factor EnvC (AmiA/AmiB activator)
MMETSEIEHLAEAVEKMVDRLKAITTKNKDLMAQKKSLEDKVLSLQRQVQKSQKEGKQTSQLIADNKGYKKTCTLVKTKVVSMLAKVDSLQ